MISASPHGLDMSNLLGRFFTHASVSYDYSIYNIWAQINMFRQLDERYHCSILNIIQFIYIGRFSWPYRSRSPVIFEVDQKRDKNQESGSSICWPIDCQLLLIATRTGIYCIEKKGGRICWHPCYFLSEDGAERVRLVTERGRKCGRATF